MTPLRQDLRLGRWDRSGAARAPEEKTGTESEVRPGSLYASGLIAAGSVFGLLAIIINLLQDPELSKRPPGWAVVVFHLPWPAKMFAFGEKFMPHLSQANALGVALFALLAISLYASARKK